MPEKMTVGDLKDRLAGWNDDWEIQFNGLTFYRLKVRGDELVNMEFNEIFNIVPMDDE